MGPKGEARRGGIPTVEEWEAERDAVPAILGSDGQPARRKRARPQVLCPDGTPAPTPVWVVPTVPPMGRRLVPHRFVAQPGRDDWWCSLDAAEMLDVLNSQQEQINAVVWAFETEGGDVDDLTWGEVKKRVEGRRGRVYLDGLVTRPVL